MLQGHFILTSNSIVSMIANIASCKYWTKNFIQTPDWLTLWSGKICLCLLVLYHLVKIIQNVLLIFKNVWCIIEKLNIFDFTNLFASAANDQETTICHLHCQLFEMLDIKKKLCTKTRITGRRDNTLLGLETADCVWVVLYSWF